MAAAGALESGDSEPRLQLLRGHAYHCLPTTLRVVILVADKLETVVMGGLLKLGL